MANKSNYQCVLYEPGDKVRSRFLTLFGDDDIQEIESTEFKHVGIFPCLFLKFVGKANDISDLSNYYLPAAETVEKYKNGLVYYNEVKVKKQTKERVSSNSTVHSTFARQLKRDNTLTEEDLKPRVLPQGMFNARAPLKKKDDE